MIETLKKLYSFFSIDELDKLIPKTRIDNLDKSFKIVFVKLNGNGELLLYERNRLKDKMQFNSKFYTNDCNINIFYNINDEFSMDKRFVQEILQIKQEIQLKRNIQSKKDKKESAKAKALTK